MSTLHTETLERANAAITAGDFEGFLAFCTDDTEWTFVGDTTLRGKAAVREWMKSTYREPPKFEVNRMSSEADSVAALGEITLKDERGNEVRHSYCDVWQFRGGKMAALQAFVVAHAD